MSRAKRFLKGIPISSAWKDAPVDPDIYMAFLEAIRKLFNADMDGRMDKVLKRTESSLDRYIFKNFPDIHNQDGFALGLGKEYSVLKPVHVVDRVYFAELQSNSYWFRLEMQELGGQLYKIAQKSSVKEI